MGKYNFQLELEDKNPLSIIAMDINENSKILEFGPANGRLTKYLYEQKKCIVDIVEIDGEAGENAKVYARYSILGKKGDIELYQWKNEFPDNEYDYIIFADVLEHLRDPKKVLHATKKKLNATGVIWVSIPNISHNSVIIDLINDKFDYSSTGLMDDTHIKFFTRESFLKMINEIGLCSSKEYSICNRVGENEIQAKYSDISKELFKLLISRPMGNIYQYVYQLVPNERFVEGQCGRMVNYDKTSYYQLSCRFCEKYNKDYSYEKEYTINYFPGKNCLLIPLEISHGSIQIALLNSCCIVSNIHVQAFHKGKWTTLDCTSSNVTYVTENLFYFTKKDPILEFEVDDCSNLRVYITYISFDCDYSQINCLLDTIVEHENIYGKKIKELEEQIKNQEHTIKEKDKEFQKSSETYECIIMQKDKEFQESINVYENTIRQKEKEFLESANIYEGVIKQKDREFQESVEIYENVITQKEHEFQESVEIYEGIIKQKEKEIQENKKNYKKFSIHQKSLYEAIRINLKKVFQLKNDEY